MRPWKRGLAAAILTVGGGVSALAQVTAPRDPNMPDPKNVPPEKIAPQSPHSTGTTSETAPSLSERLERSEGVIKPPSNVDPGITTRAPVPDPGTTPVIRPPGSPGGDQTLQPK
jgi:hypothetical protein